MFRIKFHFICSGRMFGCLRASWEFKSVNMMSLFCKCCESIKPAASCNKIAHSDWLKEVSSALFLFDDLSPVLLSPSAVGPGSGQNHHGIQISHRRRQRRPVPPQRVPAGLRKLRQVRRRRPSARDAAARS